jgi:hypothetical protein
MRFPAQYYRQLVGLVARATNSGNLAVTRSLVLPAGWPVEHKTGFTSQNFFYNFSKTDQLFF